MEVLLLISVATLAGVLLLMFSKRYLSTAAPAPPDTAPMTASWQRMLFVYFSILGPLLIWLLVKFMGIVFPPTKYVLQRDFQTAQAGGQSPLVAVCPQTLVAAEYGQELLLFGTELQPGAHPLINGNRRPSQRLNQNMFSVSLSAGDMPFEGSIDVALANPDGSVSNSHKVWILRPRGFLILAGALLPITRETQLFCLVLIAGTFGSYSQALRTLTRGRRPLQAGTLWSYVVQPYFGMVTALIVHTLLLGGMGVLKADAQGVTTSVAVAMLAGLFTEQAWRTFGVAGDKLFGVGATSSQHAPRGKEGTQDNDEA